jgi:hypothetical protein
MTAAGRTARVVLSADREADAQEIAQLLERVRAEVAEHEYDVAADPAVAPVPGGAKAVDPASVNSFLVALAASGGVLTSLIGVLQGWLLRSSARMLVVEIDGDRLELAGATSAERQRLIDAWLSRHDRPPGGDRPDAGAGP